MTWNVMNLGHGKSPNRDYRFESFPSGLPKNHGLIVFRGDRTGLYAIRDMWDKQVCRPREYNYPPWWDVLPQTRIEHLVNFHKGPVGNLFDSVGLKEFQTECKRLKIELS